MIRVRSERDYAIKIIDYKGNLLSAFKLPKTGKDAYKAIVALVRLYERAKKYSFLTKDLFIAIKTYAEALYTRESALRIALKSPVLLKHFKEILDTPIEEFEEEIIYGKVREREDTYCSICSVQLVYPAYVVFKKEGKEVKRSAPIGIKCLNRIAKKLIEHAQKITASPSDSKNFSKKEIGNLVEKIEINWEKIKEDTALCQPTPHKKKVELSQLCLF